jgi:uridine kinase
MTQCLSFDEAIEQIAVRIGLRIVAIDGLPCAGKSTMAERLAKRIGAQCVQLDEFVLPKTEWPLSESAAFPFKFIRYNAFLAAVEALAIEGQCLFRPFDWNTLAISERVRTVKLGKPVIIEGVSSLHPRLCGLYDVRVFVESNRATTLQVATERSSGLWREEWQDLLLPSVDLYLRTEPQKRADLLVAGRGSL